MASKPKTVARASTRTKASAGSTTTRATNTRSTPTPPLTDSLAKKGSVRKPFVDRNGSPERKGRTGVDMSTPLGKGTFAKAANATYLPIDTELEPISAFLRIRPQLGEEDSSPSQSKPYLEPISSTTVRMSDPSLLQPMSRLSSLPQSSVYTFSHIFPPETSQSDFFKQTTLPLVKDVLEGQNGLIFAYGVTNSGKTYTVQGGSEEGSAGILPRTLDVMFNSIDGLHGDGRFRPVRLQGVEATLSSSSSSQSSQSTFDGDATRIALADVLMDLPNSDPDTDPTAFKLDRNHEFTIWLSYAEIYNEKVYDLFASIDDSDGTSGGRSQLSGIPRPTSTFLNLPVPSSQSKPLLLTRKALPVKPCPPSDTDEDTASGGKYVAGLRQLRVTSSAQAKALLRLGQMHRQVFGTLANSTSSRSHAMVTIKVLRVHKGERNNPTSIQSSRLTLVDLAGSERTRNTQTTGERLREAGNINKSLMVLGQCMETMRTNQRALARSLNAVVSENSRFDTRDVKKGLAIVPFRHSKLTEVLMDYFVGEGRTVMIVNVNPYDTGYDENSHVMKFSAIAREVTTTAPTAAARAITSIPQSKTSLNPSTASEVIPHRRKVTISMCRPGDATNETHLEVLEEDEELGDEDEEDEDEHINPLVDALFDEIETLRMQLFQSEMRCVVIEAQTREEIMTEMEERMRKMEAMYTRRLMQEVEQYEMKMDAKIEMLQRSGMLTKGTLSGKTPELSAEPEELEDISEENEDDAQSDEEEEDTDNDDGNPYRSDSPLAGKRSKCGGDSSTFRYSPARDSDLESEDMATQSMFSGKMYETDDIPTLPTPPNSQPNEEGKYPVSKARARAQAKGAKSRQSTRSTRNSSMSQIIQKAEAMTLEEDDDDAAVIIPNKQSRQGAISHAGLGAEYVPQQGETDTRKRKKRQLSKKPVVTEEDIQHTMGTGSSKESSRPLRRSTRGNP